ncbi:Uncharacterised protein [uncultured archaeon]|nr:Uncharacterised protein [uncultured archaeon]
MVEFVGVNVAAKHLQAGLLVLFQERRACEANKEGLGQYALHCIVQFGRLGAVAFVHKHIEFALDAETRRQGFLHLGGKALHIGFVTFSILTAEFVNERAHQNGTGIIETGYQVGTALGAVDVLLHAHEHLFDLVI